MRLIDADDLKEWECEKCEYENKDDTCKESCGTMQRIDEMPTIDAEPIRHGHWIMINEPDENGNALYQCSECYRGETHTPIVEVPYCWHCGAKMDEVTE